MNIENDVDTASVGLGWSSPALPANSGALDLAETLTPAGIKSSPPTMSSHQLTMERENGNGSSQDAKSDSEAETVVLPGINGHSPSKIRAIKLEDKPNEMIVNGDSDADINKIVPDMKLGAVRKEGAPSRKRKRKEHSHSKGNGDPRTGNSSGLSSVPTSPVATRRSSLSESANSDSDTSKSTSARLSKVKARSTDAGSERTSHRAFSAKEDQHKEHRRTRRQRSDGLDSERRKDSSLALQSEINSRPHHARSASPISQGPRRSTSRQLSTSSGATNGQNQKKKRLPAPLRTVKDRQSIGYPSGDESSTGESTHRRRSRPRNLATPPTGDSSASHAKMAPHKKKTNSIGQTPFFVSCNQGDLEEAKLLLIESPEDLDRADNDQNTPLQAASLNGYEDIVDFLIKAGCNIHCQNHIKDTPLLDAVENSHLAVVKLLLEAGVNPRVRNQQGEDPINKIDVDDIDGPAIRDVLMIARQSFSASTLLVPSIPQSNPEIFNERSRRTQSHGRSAKTGENQLFISYNEKSVRSAAASGNYEQVVWQINTKWPNGGFDDPESVVAAAKGGHDDVLEILLGLGGADPDPAPVSRLNKDQATPMLAAIGGENIKVIKLLLANAADGRLDPTRMHDGSIYSEIARERGGRHWEEEERMLKEAYEAHFSKAGITRPITRPTSTSRSDYKKLDSNGRHSSSYSHGARREAKPTVTSSSTPVKRGPGRPRKDGTDISPVAERESGSSTSKQGRPNDNRKRSDSDTTRRSDSEAAIVSPLEPDIVKPRRKLVSGRDLKGEREKQRRASVASMASAHSHLDPASAADAGEVKSNSLKRKPSVSDLDMASERSFDPAQSNKRDDSKDRLSMIRGESPTKRPRISTSPPAESSNSTPVSIGDRATSKKRRRLESEGGKRIKTHGETRFSSSPDRNTTSFDKSRSTAKKSVSGKSHSSEIQSQSNSTPEEALVMQHTHQSSDTSTRVELASTYNPNISTKNRTSPSSGFDLHLARDDEEVERKAREVREQADLVAKIKREVEDQIEANRVEEVRLKEEALERQRLEEAAEREREEAELREQEKRAEVEAHRRAEDERRRLYDEQQRLHREEQEKRRAERIAEKAAERERIRTEEEAARLAKLPALLRWFDGHAQAATTEVASNFKVLQGVRYDTIKPEATGGPDGREQWLLNTQVALLLGEKDLQLSRYTAWERIPVSLIAKEVLWKSEFEKYAMITEPLRAYNQDYYYCENGLRCRVSYDRLNQIIANAKALFLALDMFFVKASDFMFIVPKFSHLRNMRLELQYRELPANDALPNPLTPCTKWREDPDADANFGFAPGTKYYVNGELMGEDKPKILQTSKTPFPETRVPRIGFRQVFPNDPEYERLCLEQGLGHLLHDRQSSRATNGLSLLQNGVIGVTPPASNASMTDEDHRRLSNTPPQTILMLEHTNGVNGII